MANEADSKDRKRRRRKGGLRVPSDNVPRRSAQADSSGVVKDVIDAEPADDPRLAVSLASAFAAIEAAEESSEATAEEPSEAVAEESSEAAAEVEPVKPAVGVEPAVEAKPAPASPVDVEWPIATASGRMESSGDSVDIAFHDEGDSKSVELDGVHDEAVAQPVDDERVARALEGSIGDVSADVEMIPDGPRTDEMKAVAPPPQAAVHEASIDNRSTTVMPIVTEEDISEVSGGVDENWNDDDVADEVGVQTLAGRTPVHGEAVGARLEAGDSGELLTDDLIEEFDSGAISQPDDAIPPPVIPVAQVEASGSGSSRAGGDHSNGGRAATVIEPVEELAASDVVEVGNASTAPAAAVVTVRPAPPPAPPTSSAGDAAAPAPSQPPLAARRKGKPWFEEIFDEDYLRTLPFLTPHETQKQALFVADSLGAEPGANVLDLGCGYGRHAMELAARGIHVVGLDASLPLLIRGADEAQRRGLAINFVHGDMRELTFEEQFDGAYCLFGTFGYFDDETNKKAAQAVERALKPGGRFVVEVLNRDYLIADLPSRAWWEGDGCVVLEEVEFNYFSSRIVSNRSVVFDDGRQLEQEISMRAYSLHELGKLLHAAGFRILEISGSIDTKGRFFGTHSREIVVVCEKRSMEKDGDSGAVDGLGDGHSGTSPGTGG